MFGTSYGIESVKRYDLAAQKLYNSIFVDYSEGVIDTIYGDIKLFLYYYIRGLEYKNHSYDNLNTSKIIAVVNLLSLEQKVSIYKFVRKKLLEKSLVEEWSRIKREYFISQILIIKQQKRWWINVFSLCRLAYLRSLYSYWYLLYCLLCSFFVYMVILLPNPGNAWPSIYTLKYEKISSHFIVNHILNLLNGILGIHTEFRIIPKNSFACILGLVGEVLKVVFLVKYVIDKLLKKLDSND